MTEKRRFERRATARLSAFARRLDQELRRLIPIRPEGVVVAVSGGADSTALLLALDELIRAKRYETEIVIAHLDHRLRSHSRQDAEWVAELSKKLGHKVVIGAADVRQRAKATADNLEQAARQMRYEFFERVARENKVSVVVTAHTLDDQAETVLLRLIRGSAADGLAGMEPSRQLSPDSEIMLVRPLITWARRSDTERYCLLRKIEFRSDEMNEDVRFDRVKVRKQLLPLMQSFNSRVVEALGRSAVLLREDAEFLAESAQALLRDAINGAEAGRDTTCADATKTTACRLNVKVLAGAPAAVRRRAIRHWLRTNVGSLKRLEMSHFLAVERLLEKRGGRIVELPNGIRVKRQRDWLYLTVKTVEKRGGDL